MTEEKRTILIVDDTETNIDILLELLGESYDILVSLDGEGALEIVKEDKVDLILLDIMMPDLDGYEVCRRLKSASYSKDVPVIFITAKVDEDSIEKAYEVGGMDYVTKPFKPRELLARVKTQIRLSALVNHLEFIASYDEMTGIYNRRKFFSLATQMFETAKENLYAIMIDIDKFKNINDTYGHPVGDEVIKAVTSAIAKNIGSDVIFGRIGGEEFAIICKSGSRDFVIKTMEIIREAVQALKTITSENEIVSCTISQGVSYADDGITTLDELLKEADVALYEAKGSGRNRVIFR